MKHSSGSEGDIRHHYVSLPCQTPKLLNKRQRQYSKPFRPYGVAFRKPTSLGSQSKPSSTSISQPSYVYKHSSNPSLHQQVQENLSTAFTVRTTQVHTTTHLRLYRFNKHLLPSTNFLRMASSSRDTSQFDIPTDKGRRKPRAPQSPTSSERPSSFWDLSPSGEKTMREHKDRVISDRKEEENPMRHGHRRHGHRSHRHRRHNSDQQKEEYRPPEEGRRERRRSDSERDEPRRPEEERKTPRRWGQEEKEGRRPEDAKRVRRPSDWERKDPRRPEDGKRRRRPSGREKQDTRYSAEPQQESHWSTRALSKVLNKINGALDSNIQPKFGSHLGHGRPKRRYYD